MTPEDREKLLLRLCDEALSKDARDCAAFLDEACSGDAALRRDVESMLGGRDDAPRVLESPKASSATASLTPGTRLGRFEIQAFVGAGGMGQVYKADDKRLGRTVAIKVLPRDLAADPDRRRRFEQEARAASALDHPHICALYDVGSAVPSTTPDQPPIDFLVMEFLEGRTLNEELVHKRRAIEGSGRKLPVPEALEHAIQIADALAAAHRAGVIHRDLKPGNIMLTKSGVKLLDFGLAKLRAAERASNASGTLPTVTSPVTSGVVFGTAPYIAPEVIAGKEADARSDIFAFGCVLYEMLAGRRAFEGDSVAQVAATILQHDPPPLASLRPDVPAVLQRLVHQCLAKSPDDRPDTAHDVANDMRWLREVTGPPERARHWPARGLRLASAVVAGLALVFMGAGINGWLHPAPERELVWNTWQVKPAENLNSGGGDPYCATPGGSRTALAWTPDGTLLFVGLRSGVRQLYQRRHDAAEATPVEGTKGAQALAVSADGQWVAFWADRSIRKVKLGEALVSTVAQDGGYSPPWGLVWDEHGDLWYSDRGHGIFRVRAGGKPTCITTLREGEIMHTLPCPLPGGRTVLYTVRRREFSWGDEAIVAEDLRDRTVRELVHGGSDARYVATGHLLFMRQGQLWAVPFDPVAVRVTGPEVHLLDDVSQALSSRNTADITGAGQFALSGNGTLAWVSSPVVEYPEGALVTVDRTGRVTRLNAPVRSYGTQLRLSPDHRRLAVTIRTLTESGLWLYDLERGGDPVPLVRKTEAWAMAWSPDGKQIAFRLVTGGRQMLAAVPSDPPAEPQVLGAALFFPSEYHPQDSQRLVGITGYGSAGGAVATISIKETTAPVELAAGRQPTFSPDGRWLAYTSDASGRAQTWIVSYPEPSRSRPEPVSRDGGTNPAWNPNGRELFFLQAREDAPDEMSMMSVDFDPGPPTRIGTPHPLFPFDQRELRLYSGPVRSYDVGPGGRRFYGVQQSTPAQPPVITLINVVENWVEKLKAKVPVGR